MAAAQRRLTSLLPRSRPRDDPFLRCHPDGHIQRHAAEPRLACKSESDRVALVAQRGRARSALGLPAGHSETESGWAGARFVAARSRSANAFGFVRRMKVTCVLLAS